MLRLGILGCAEIALRRFMPAVQRLAGIEVAAVAEEYDKSKQKMFCDTYGLAPAEDFEAILQDKSVDAVYIPQPPALHYRWAKRGLECGKHILLEKPSTTSYADTKALTEYADARGLVLHENYMFLYHDQLEEIKKILDAGTIGNIRLVRADFSFPMRQQNDFRYNKELGGGALLDAGGYPIRLAAWLLGKTIRLDTAKLNHSDAFDVDMYGSASFSNSDGIVCQVSFGMDCAYQCSLYVLGSKGSLYTDRIFTAPEMLTPEMVLDVQGEKTVVKLQQDSSFLHSIEQFCREIDDPGMRKSMYEDMCLQASLVDAVRKRG